MKKLKTLKDFGEVINLTKLSRKEIEETNIRVKDLPVSRKEFKIYTEDELRQEAIKWIKKFMREWKIDELPEITEENFDKEPFAYILGKYEIDKERGYVILAWIKHFFNIEDSDINENRR